KRKRKRGDYENFNSRLLKDITSKDKDDSEEKDDEYDEITNNENFLPFDEA
ncbi:3001_t:CDS:1, partial [Funneliformis caledonium]